MCKKTFGKKCFAINAVKINSRAACLALSALKSADENKFNDVMEKINKYAEKVTHENP
jgi:hypothetical protein